MVREVVHSTLDSLKTSPVFIALIALNAMMVGAAMWFLSSLAQAQASRFDILLKACMGKAP